MYVVALRRWSVLNWLQHCARSELRHAKFANCDSQTLQISHHSLTFCPIIAYRPHTSLLCIALQSSPHSPLGHRRFMNMLYMICARLRFLRPTTESYLLQHQAKCHIGHFWHGQTLPEGGELGCSHFVMALAIFGGVHRSHRGAEASVSQHVLSCRRQQWLSCLNNTTTTSSSHAMTPSWTPAEASSMIQVACMAAAFINITAPAARVRLPVACRRPTPASTSSGCC